MTDTTLATRLNQIPGIRQLALLVGIAGAVAVGVMVYSWSQGPGMTAVYTGLGEADAAAIGDALTTQGITHRIDLTRGAVLVPAAEVQRARLSLAGQGLPRGAGVGFESMREDPGLGVSQFLESARYQHALETELARTIMTLRPVQQARVHLAVPKPSPFVRNKRQPAASVVLELFPGRYLEPPQIAAVQHLVSASVPELEPGRISVVDHNGRLLSAPESDSALALTNRQFEHTQRVEESFESRVRELLAPMLGAGRISTQVTVDMDYSVSERTTERYAPDATALRSEQVSEDTSAGSAPVGVPGATSNKPPELPGTTPVPGRENVATAGAVRRQSVRNYELDKTTAYSREPVGQLRRVSVAVLVDHLPGTNAEGEAARQPLSDEQLARVESLVREAIGFTAARGDSVSVMNAPFVTDTEFVEPAAVPLWEQPQVRSLIRQGGGVLVVIIILLALIRPMLKNLLLAPATNMPALAGAGGGSVDVSMVDGMGEDTVQLSGQGGGAQRSGGGQQAGNQPFALDLKAPYEDKLTAARQVVNDDPKRVAQVVRTWVNDGN